MPSKNSSSIFMAALDGRPDSVHGHDGDDILVIGIDFGTTFSGAAWATLEDLERDHIHLITTWPGSGREEGKVPTELYYDHDQVYWGYDIPHDVDPICWFKLLLLKEEDLSMEMRLHEYIIRGRKMLRENKKSAADLIADYLRATWSHVIESIKKSCGESVVDALSFHIVITVPAIWKPYARQRMNEAATQAGLLDQRAAGNTTMSFAPEPEAAGLSTMCEPGRKVKVGDVFMITDAGGGTVDLISYKIGGLHPISVEEAVEGTGGLCGGILIDEDFELLCKNRLGRRWYRLSQTGQKDIMRREWEYGIKPDFKPGNDGKEYIVRVSPEAFGKGDIDDTTQQPFIKNGSIHFRSCDIQQVFTKSFEGIDTLVNEQIQKANGKGLKISAIILVGGLGSSPYLYQYLKHKYGNAGIGVLQSGGMKPRTAICRGAVIKGFIDGVSAGGAVSKKALATINAIAPIKVTSTVSRFSIGMLCSTEFDERYHLLKDRQWNDVTQKYWAVRQVSWYIKRGENSSKIDPVRSPFANHYKEHPGPLSSVTLVYCEDELPPSRATESVKELCTISFTIDVPWTEFRMVPTPNGALCKALDFGVEMIPSGASVDFGVYVGGRKQGGQNFNIVFQ